MTNNQRVHPSDLQHEQNDAATAILLFDADGEHLGNLPVSFTPDQVKSAVALANAWYAAGVQDGRRLAQEQMRAALGIQV